VVSRDDVRFRATFISSSSYDIFVCFFGSTKTFHFISPLVSLLEQLVRVAAMIGSQVLT
jgi:hypothetical protein